MVLRSKTLWTVAPNGVSLLFSYIRMVLRSKTPFDCCVPKLYGLLHLQTELSSRFRFLLRCSNIFSAKFGGKTTCFDNTWTCTIKINYESKTSLRCYNKNIHNHCNYRQKMFLPNGCRYTCTSFASDKSLKNQWKSGQSYAANPSRCI